MNAAVVRRIVNHQPKGVKGPMEQVLQERAMAEDEAGTARTGMTIGEIGAALGFDKTRHAEVSATLTKLREEGKIRFETVPRIGSRGRRYVKRYRWALKIAKAA